jgi:hypothetical protein
MISRNSDNGFLKAHWDWLVAAVGLLALVASVVNMAIAYGVDPDEAAADAVSDLGGRKRAATGVEAVVMDAFTLATKDLKNPGKIAEPAETQESFLASGRRVFCEQGKSDDKKSCGKPIPFGLKVCPLCGVNQPEEEKIVLDSDGDGLSDDYETANGMNPNDPADIHLDLDGDGFTNMEEFDAKTKPNDRTSHPDYLDSLRVELPLKETILPFFFDSYTPIPSGFRFYFKPLKAKTGWAKGSASINLLLGEDIGTTGYMLKSFEKKAKRVAIKGSSGQKEVDVSFVTIVRKTDGKTLVLALRERNKSVDTQAKLVYERHGTKEFVVVPGDEIELNGSVFKVTDIKRAGKSVKVSFLEVETGRNRTIEALEQ